MSSRTPGWIPLMYVITMFCAFCEVGTEFINTVLFSCTWGFRGLNCGPKFGSVWCIDCFTVVQSGPSIVELGRHRSLCRWTLCVAARTYVVSERCKLWKVSVLAWSYVRLQAAGTCDCQVSVYGLILRRRAGRRNMWLSGVCVGLILRRHAGRRNMWLSGCVDIVLSEVGRMHVDFVTGGSMDRWMVC
jgi:hypothetical protein